MPIYLLSPSTILVVEVILKLNNMIDKKIEEAKEEIYEDRFLLNGEEVVFDNDTKEEMFYKNDIKEAIGLGAKFAINEFIKDLWHAIDENPKKYHKCLVEVVYHRPLNMTDEIDYVTSHLTKYRVSHQARTKVPSIQGCKRVLARNAKASASWVYEV